MGAFKRIKQFFNRNSGIVRYEMLTENNGNYYGWDGDLYASELVRTCTRPFATAVGKLAIKHLRETQSDTKINPSLHIRALLLSPNPLMSMQKLQEKLANQLILNNNAFAYINRNVDGKPIEIYPLAATSVEAVYDKEMNLFLKFTMRNGRTYTYSYNDIIHLRRDYSDNDIFGASNAKVLRDLLEIVAVSDKSIVNAIKNSNIIKWLLKFTTNLNPADLKQSTKDFADAFLNTANAGTSVAAVDVKSEAQQIEPKDYVPNAAITDRIKGRVYAFFGVNEKIVMNNFTEDEWNSYYEAAIEPVSRDLAEEFSRKLFSMHERAIGNKVVFDAINLSFASAATKLNFLQMVDRGAMTPNEWRRILNLGPIEGGDKPIRRLDTAVVGNDGDSANEEN